MKMWGRHSKRKWKNNLLKWHEARHKMNGLIGYLLSELKSIDIGLFDQKQLIIWTVWKLSQFFDLRIMLEWLLVMWKNWKQLYKITLSSKWFGLRFDVLIFWMIWKLDVLDDLDCDSMWINYFIIILFIKIHSISGIPHNTFRFAIFWNVHLLK